MKQTEEYYYGKMSKDKQNVYRAMLHGLMELSDEFLIPQVPTTDGNHFYYREKKLSFTKLEDVYKRALQAAGKTRDKKAIITLNWPQAVLRFHFAEQQAEGKVFIEEVNEGEKL